MRLGFEITNVPLPMLRDCHPLFFSAIRACYNRSHSGVHPVQLAINTRENGSVTILSLEGRLCLGDDPRAVRDQVKTLMDNGSRQLLIEMEKLSFIDSAGIGALVGCFTAARKSGGVIKLLKASDKVRHALTITKLLAMFELFDDEAQAVASFKATASA